MKINLQLTFYFIIICNLAFGTPESSLQSPHYYCTPSDSRHYHLVKNLIGSIHHADFENLGEIAVFNLGLSEEEINELNHMQKVTVHDPEMANPDMLTFFHTDTGERKVRGFFSWKPVVIKEALDLFPYVLYCDAGTTILKPLDTLFDYIQEKGYFLLSCSHNINCNVPNRITKNVLDEIVATFNHDQQEMILSDTTYMIDAGIQGLSREMLNDYVLPIYKYAQDINLFKDDGTAIFGLGGGRHDQTLYTIQAYILDLTIHQEGFMELDTAHGTSKIHIYWDKDELNSDSII